MARAVAIDFGASSARYGLGELENGRIRFSVARQIPHDVREESGKLVWDFPLLLGLCREAIAFAAENGAGSVGIDTWGVDIGFLDESGRLLDPPVCYRDPSHARAFEALTSHRGRLYELTGCQHQPFNTIYQLVARREEDPSLPDRAALWLPLPDFLGQQLGVAPHIDLTHASTTQLLGLDAEWSDEAFEIAGWPLPRLEPAVPGVLADEVAPGVRLARVGGHDTASAVAGFGPLPSGCAFANIGTWSLVGTVLDHPIATAEAARANLTNERTVDGRVRLLKNVPGFYVINRVFAEMKPAPSIPAWLDAAEPVSARIDLQHPDLFNPESMVEVCADLATAIPESSTQWAGMLIGSLADAIAAVPRELASVTEEEFHTVVLGGGGSQCAALCRAVEAASGLRVLKASPEATLLGNLATQFWAQGAVVVPAELAQIVQNSA
jgi:rhamnulokinase